MTFNNENILEVLLVDGFDIYDLNVRESDVTVHIKNNKFRSQVQAISASTLQRFTNDNIKTVYFAIHRDLQLASYQLSLEEITELQFGIVKKQEQPHQSARLSQ